MLQTKRSAMLKEMGKVKDEPKRALTQGQVPIAYDDYPARVEAGPYEARCIDAPPAYFDAGFRRWVQALTFELHPNLEVLHAFLNLGTGKQPHAGQRSNYFKAWVIAKGRPPRRGDRMTADVFLNQLFEVDVSDVSTDCEGLDKAEPLIYSRVSRVVRRLT